MTVQLTPKQAAYVREAHHRWNFAIGAVRSGKSYIAIQYVIPNGLVERSGKKGINLILGASKENIERNVLTPMRDIWGSKLIGGINSRNWATVFGEKVYCIGAEKINQVAKLRGSEIKFVYIDEATDINKEVFELLKSRLSLPYSVCHAAANPSYPSHFIKEFIDSAQKGVDVYCQRYTIYDNYFLPQEYIHSLETEYAGTVYFQRYILGEWTLAEGLIYPMYEDAIEKPPEKTPEKRIMSVDYGTQNAFAAILWSKYGDVWYAEREYYYSGRDTGKQKTDEEYGTDMDKWVEDIGGNIKVVIDPSAASFIALLRKRPKFSVIKADNSVADGIRETATALKTGKIKINPALTNWRKEVEGYVWDDTTMDDVPVKVNDHLMDAMRYFVKTFRIATKKPSNYVPLW